MQSLRTRPHLLALALASVLAAPVALAQQVIADGTAQTPAAGDYSATGVGNHAFHALNGGSIVPLGPVNVSASGDGASAARAEGAGSRIELNGATLVTTGFGATTALATTGGELQLTAIDVLNQGTGMGVVAQTGSQATLQDVNIRMEGVSSVGLSGGGNITMTGGSISAMGLGSRAVSAIGATMALSNVAIEGASGIWLENNNRLDLAGSTVKANGIALDINGFGNTVTVSDSTLHSTANGTGTVTMFADSTLAMAGGAIVSEGDRAVGIDMRGGSADLERVEVTTSGESSHGLYADYTTFGTRPGINARAVQIHTSGSSAIGAVARQGGSIQLQDSVIRTEGQEAYGVLAGGSGAMTLTNTDVRTEGEGAWAAVINNSGSLRIDGGSLESVQHGGVWVRSSRDAGLTLANGAQLTGGNGTALALDAAVAGRFDVRLEDGAQMDGDVVIHPDDVAAGLVPQSEVHVALDAASLWSGGTTLAQTVALAGGSQWTLQGASEVGALSLDDSALVLGTDARGGVGTLTVTGNLTTTGARLMFRGALADDASELGHLHVLGDTGGDASISVENLGGSGAQTVDGIELIKVDGASLGTYTLSGRAVAGLYEYLLHKGGVAGGDGNWYLRSAAIDPCEVDPTGPGCTPVIPDPCEVDPTGPGCTPVIPDPCEVDPEAPGCTPVIPEPILRPEPGAYLANQVAAVDMFQHRLHDRRGEPSFAHGRGAWARVSQQQPQITTLGQQLSVRGSSAVLQIGSDLFQREGVALGVMLGSGRSNSTVASDLTEYRARGRVRGTAVGIYGTWLQDPAQGGGLYLDSSVQYARFDNRVEGDGLARESYDSRAGIGSLEGGYTFNVWQGVSSNLYVQPQLQLSYVDYRADRHVERNGTVVDNDDAGGLGGRAGVRVFGRSTREGNLVQPFVGVNWLRGSRTSTLDFDGETLAADVPRNRYEVQAGAELRLGNSWGAWAGLSVQRGEQEYRNVAGQLGVRRTW